MSNDNSLIEIKLIETHSLTRRPCTVCGGCTEKNHVAAETDGICVCETCLKDGRIDERLAKNANGLENYARRVRSLIGRLRVPSYEEWQAEEQFFDHFTLVLEIFEQAEERGTPITSREQLRDALNDDVHEWGRERAAETMDRFADRYLDAWRSKYKTEYEERKTRQREMPVMAFGDGDGVPF
jgi:hypothetical protein